MNIAEHLVRRIPADARAEYEQLLVAARLDEPMVSDSDALAAFVGPSALLLDELGRSGRSLRDLTGGGASDTPAQRSVRDQLMASKLVRAHDGVLMRTPIGDSLVEQPDKLWRHLAATITNAGHEIASDGVTLLLLVIAADEYGSDYQDRIAAGLAALGWRTTDGDELDKWDAFEAVVAQYRFLSHAGAVSAGEGESGATTIGADFARTALRVESAQS